MATGSVACKHNSNGSRNTAPWWSWQYATEGGGASGQTVGTTHISAHGAHLKDGDCSLCVSSFQALPHEKIVTQNNARLVRPGRRINAEAHIRKMVCFLTGLSSFQHMHIDLPKESGCAARVDGFLHHLHLRGKLQDALHGDARKRLVKGRCLQQQVTVVSLRRYWWYPHIIIHQFLTEFGQDKIPHNGC